MRPCPPLATPLNAAVVTRCLFRFNVNGGSLINKRQDKINWDTVAQMTAHPVYYRDYMSRSTHLNE